METNLHKFAPLVEDTPVRTPVARGGGSQIWVGLEPADAIQGSHDKRQCGRPDGVRCTFFRFRRDGFAVTFQVIFSDASVTFFVTFLPRTPFAGLLLRNTRMSNALHNMTPYASSSSSKLSSLGEVHTGVLQELVAYGMAIFQTPKNIFQRPKFPGKSPT